MKETHMMWVQMKLTIGQLKQMTATQDLDLDAVETDDRSVETENRSAEHMTAWYAPCLPTVWGLSIANNNQKYLWR